MKTGSTILGLVVGFIVWQVVGNTLEGGKAGWNIFVWIVAGPAAALAAFGIVYGILSGIERRNQIERERVEAAARQEAARQATERQRKESADREKAASKKRLISQSDTLNNHVRTLSLELPSLVQKVHAHLDCAETKLKEGAASPFWDAVERSTNDLARYYESIQTFTSESRLLRKLAKRSIGGEELRVVTLNFTQLPGAQEVRDAADRMTAIVDEGHRHPKSQFATVYELRKLNKLLVGGFNSLAEAIDQVGGRINSSISAFSSQMSSKMQDAQFTHEMISDSLGDANEKLDNIQNRRVP